MVKEALTQAVSLHHQGQLMQARTLYRHVLTAQPANFNALHMLGVVSYQTNNLQEAVRLIAQAIAVNPKVAVAHANLGLALRDLRQYEAALLSFERAIVLNPNVADAHNTHGFVLSRLGRHGNAIRSCDQAILLKPDFAEAYNNRGCALNELKRYQDALRAFERAIAVNPDFAEAYSNRGNALKDLGQLDAALESFARAVALKSDDPEIHINRGNVLKELNRIEAALLSYGHAIALNSNNSEVHLNCGNALNELNRTDAALHSFTRAVALDARDARVYNNIGNALLGLRRADDAMRSYNHVIVLQPDDADAHWNIGLCHLLLGDFEQGWKKYEWRWHSSVQRPHLRAFRQPQWSGKEPLAGKTVLLYSEQGLGDTIQFCRYARMVSEQGARVVLEVQLPLKTLMHGLNGVTDIVATGEPLPPFDYHCPLLSLPLAFGTDISTIPASKSYLAADASKLARWRTRLGFERGPLVGLVWAGSSAHVNDRNRSIPLHDLAGSLPSGFRYTSLQKELRDADYRALRSRTDIHHFGNELEDFSDTAALCDMMDIVITVDTSVAHLAGALGKPTWILLPFSPDWRWLLDREDTPWYPSVRLFRQPAPGDWRSLLAHVAAELSRQFSAAQGASVADH